jgi:hypothetical protein
MAWLKKNTSDKPAKSPSVPQTLKAALNKLSAENNIDIKDGSTVSELKDSIFNNGKIILRDAGDILMAGLIYEGSVIGRIKAELVGSADGIDVVNKITGGPLWLIHRDIEEEYRGLGLIKELLVSIHEYIESNGGATIVYGVVSDQAKENTIKLNEFEKIPVTVVDFGNIGFVVDFGNLGFVVDFGNFGFVVDFGNFG